ncbi:MAG: RNA polymerase sigma factor [Syntrophomonadaceae bacterium]|nr:RNA polymerase sigma factor [Syntrophomonadaceae bacterium]
MKGISQKQAEEIFRDYSPKVYQLALFLSKSPALADDITQDTFLQVFKKYTSYDPQRPIYPWIYKIALNITRNTLRRQKWLDLFGEPPECGYLTSVENIILRDELAAELWQKVNKLTLKSREVIVLHYYLELKLQETATILGIPLGTCKSRLNSALSTLRKQLEENSHLQLKKGDDLYGIV